MHNANPAELSDSALAQIKEDLLSTLTPLAVPTPLHPEGIATIRTERFIAVYQVGNGMIEVYDTLTCERVYCDGSRNAFVVNVCIPGDWLPEIFGTSLAAVA